MSSAFGGHNLMRKKTAESAGVSCVVKNIDGVVSLCDMLKTSYGVRGMYKLVVTGHQQTLISRSVSSIISGCDIEHPALRMLAHPVAHLAMLGDCTGFLLGLIGEVLRRSALLIQQGVLPTEIAGGVRECLDVVGELVGEEAEELEFDLEKKEVLQRVLSGLVKEQKIGELLAESIAGISKEGTFPTDNIRVTKVNVGSLEESERMQGMLLECAPCGSVVQGENLKVAVYACPLVMSNLETKGTVLLRSAEDLLSFTAEDEAAVRKHVESLVEGGVGLVVCSGSVDPLMLDYFGEKNVAVLKIQSKHDLRRLCILFGARFSNTLRPLGEENFGRCRLLEVCTYGEKKYTKVTGPGGVETLILRGSLPAQLEECERVIMKAMCALQVCATESMQRGKVRVLKGAGACEKKFAERLKAKAAEYTDVRQMAFNLFAESILQVGDRSRGPEESSAQEAYEGIYDVAEIKERALEYACSLSASILSISQIFITKSEDALQAPKRQGHWDDQD
ncbi:T-complex protein 1 subunit theta [Nematocida sp. AWRm77]|nr:T-complex protein 1 subunit theta [Nematocida sp. AWRm77]